jgi:tRNA-2-methylthio-N6-dimethylallyladenosine synthase
MTQRLVETAARLPKVCEHMELPVQSGDDAVLRRMGRGYTVAHYRDLVARIRQAMPGVGLATDVIVGFPGETEAQFEATRRLLEDLRFDVVHVAAYSPRTGIGASGAAGRGPTSWSFSMSTARIGPGNWPRCVSPAPGPGA